MELDRALVKSQAKQLMKDRIINLFLITMIMSVIMNFFNVSFNANDVYYKNHSNNSPGWNQFGDNDNPIENFGGNLFDEDYFNGITGNIDNLNVKTGFRLPGVLGHTFNGAKSTISAVITVFLAPLEIGIAFLYLRLSRNEYNGFGKEIDNSFRAAFDKNYLKKVGVLLVRRILVLFFTILLIVPGIIKHYQLYFVEFISADKSGLTIGQTNELSKKLTNDHKGELFKLDLSFLGWFLLCVFTFGIATIYVIPYYNTVKALYYQNFKARCMQEMKISELDFMTDEERTQMYNSQNGNYNQANNYNANNYNPSMTYNNMGQGYSPSVNYDPSKSYNPNFQQSANVVQGYNPNPSVNVNNQASYFNQPQQGEVNDQEVNSSDNDIPQKQENKATYEEPKLSIELNIDDDNSEISNDIKNEDSAQL